jgi:hypothetical protein
MKTGSAMRGMPSSRACRALADSLSGSAVTTNWVFRLTALVTLSPASAARESSSSRGVAVLSVMHTASPA